MSNVTPLRIAFIGTGAMARVHLQALSHVPTAHRVTGVCDLNASAARDFAKQAGAGTTAYPTVAALLAESKPDVVHICTPAGTHFEPACQALRAGAHVYIEKPFVETAAEAAELFRLAQERHLLICAGHQLLHDPAFGLLLARSSEVRPVTLVDSYFAFRSPTLVMHRATDRALAAQLLDVLPHPLYTLLAALAHVAPTHSKPEVVAVTATSVELQALLRQGPVSARLLISLRARPVASTLALTGGGGTLTADFVRGMVVGAGNEGTSPLEKLGNPLVEGMQLVGRGVASIVRRVVRGGGYGGLVELVDALYSAVVRGDSISPLPVAQLRRVAAVYEELAAAMPRSVPASPVARIGGAPRPEGPVAVLTGASGFFGREIARALTNRGFWVRGIGRSEQPDGVAVAEWVRADLSRALPPDALAGATVVVHAAAETAGGMEAHQRNSVDVTRNLLGAMTAAGVRRMVLVSSLSVLEPPRSAWEVQNERTPVASRPAELGAYTWGKAAAEQLVAAARDAGAIEACIVRPGALLDWDHIELPGLVGRRLFGHWHLALGRPGLPFAVCEVGRAAGVVAWCADQFPSAPPLLNLFDPAIATRGQLRDAFRARGWRGRLVWVPISAIASALTLARHALAATRGQRPEPLAAWGVLRPRRYATALSASSLLAVDQQVTDAPPPLAVSDLRPPTRMIEGALAR